MTPLPPGLSGLSLLTLPLALGAAPQDAAPAVRSSEAPTRIELLDDRALHLRMNRLESEHIELVTKMAVGLSRSGRKIDALRIAAGEPGDGRPAILIVADVDGPYVYTSGLAFDHARALAEGYGADERITALLDRTTIYVVPRADPDAAEARFESPLFERTASGHGVDNDRDGRSGEDGPQDVDGDGMITTMRVPDPEGTWIADPTDARATIEADRKKGERGRWKLMVEGRDADGDEEVAEDPEHDAVVNRNFAQRWEEHAPRAGRYPTDEPEALSLCEFVLGKPEIALVVTYGAQGNLVGKVETQGGGGQRGEEKSGALADDAALIEELGRRYRELTKNETEGEGEQAGSFQAWCYHQRGLLTLNVKPWSVPRIDPPAEQEEHPAEEAAAAEGPPEAEKPAGPEEPKPCDDARRLAWLDANGRAPWFVEWRPFEHPELGPVEIGGFAPFALIEPPAGELDALADAQLAFLLSLGDLLARVKIEDCLAEKVAQGLFEVTAALVNDSFLPLRTAAADQARTVRPARLRLVLPDGGELLAGERQILVNKLSGLGGRSEQRWLVRSANPEAISIEVDTDHAGEAQATPEVKR